MEDIVKTQNGEVVQPKVAIRTHDRIFFRGCRRRWFLGSPIKMNRDAVSLNPNLWFGTGFHFALEDYHGYNRYGDPVKAFEAYVKCFNIDLLNEKAQDFISLAPGMFEHYSKVWLPRRQEFKTLWLEGKPMVEVELEIPIPELSEAYNVEVVYQGKIDRVVVDLEGRWWIQDYKTAARFDIAKLETDPQINAYLAISEKALNHEIEGMLYLQFLKDHPIPPKITARGDVSYDKKQKTTYTLYLRALQERYGLKVSTYPRGCVDFLEELAMSEGPEGDNFIRQDSVTRTQAQKDVEYFKILAEGNEMLNPHTVMYPNPTRDCYWACPFRSVCIAMDDGSDWEWLLKEEFSFRTAEGGEENWRSKLKYPNKGLLYLEDNLTE